MPTLIEILAAKKRKPIESVTTEKKEIITLLPPVTDSLMALLFFFAARGKNKFYDYIELLEAFGLEYNPVNVVASQEQPSISLCLSFAEFYSLSSHPVAALSEAAYALTGIGRLLTDSQQKILLTYIEREIECRKRKKNEK